MTPTSLVSGTRGNGPDYELCLALALDELDEVRQERDRCLQAVLTLALLLGRVDPSEWAVLPS